MKGHLDSKVCVVSFFCELLIFEALRGFSGFFFGFCRIQTMGIPVLQDTNGVLPFRLPKRRSRCKVCVFFERCWML